MKKYIYILAISLIMCYSIGCGHTENKEVVDDKSPVIEELETQPLKFSPDYYKQEVTSLENCYYIDSNKTLWGYGYNLYHQLGDYKSKTIYVPSEKYKDKIRKNNILEYEFKTIKIANNVKHISYTGLGSLVYITEDNKLYGLGLSYAGNLMFPPKYEPPIFNNDQIKCPKLLLENVLYAEVTELNTIVLKTDGSVWVWGGNLYGEYGSIMGQKEKYSLEPVKIMDDAVLVAASGENFAVLKPDSSLWVWGNNDDGIIDGRNEGKELIEPEDRYCKTPQKIMDNVKNVWFGNPNRNYIDLENRYEIYVQKTDDSMFYWGGDLGNTPQKYSTKKDIVD